MHKVVCLVAAVVAMVLLCTRVCLNLTSTSSVLISHDGHWPSRPHDPLDTGSLPERQGLERLQKLLFDMSIVTYISRSMQQYSVHSALSKSVPMASSIIPGILHRIHMDPRQRFPLHSIHRNQRHILTRATRKFLLGCRQALADKIP